MQTFNLPEKTYGIQLVRCDVKNDRFVYYEGVAFPDNPRSTCDMYLRRASIVGRIGEGVESTYTLDILDSEHSTLAEYPIERKAARYLIEKLKMRVDH
jgi:hypothetical protein